jgi:hypothetical protein
MEEGKVSDEIFKIICDAGFMGLPFEEPNRAHRKAHPVCQKMKGESKKQNV